MGYGFCFKPTNYAKFGKSLLEIFLASALSRDSHDVLGCSGITFDDRNSEPSESLRKHYTALGQTLHARQERRIDVNAPTLKLSLAPSHNPEFRAARIVIAHTNTALWQRQR